MPERDKKIDNSKIRNDNQREFISVIYNKSNNSPKYFELQKTKLLLFIIGLPTITLIALTFGLIGLIHTSPFHLIEAYKQNSMAREAINKAKTLLQKIQSIEEEKNILANQLTEAREQLKITQGAPATKPPANLNQNDKNRELTTPTSVTTINSVGLSTLSLFHPIPAQKDRTKPAILNLSEFKVVENRDAINLQFNIIPTIIDEGKLSGLIIVLMKNELTIQVYPQAALKGSDTQITYTDGEPFSTQRFRPVEAIFLKPRKPGNYTFSVYVFARNGDLLHYQSLILPVKF